MAAGDVFSPRPALGGPNIDFIGIDNYMPLSDWRDGFDHADAQAGWPAIHDRAYLQANIAGGKASTGSMPARRIGRRSSDAPRSPMARRAPWVFRYKDLRAWWSNPHFNRRAGWRAARRPHGRRSRNPSGSPNWAVPPSTGHEPAERLLRPEVLGEASRPHFSRGWRDDAIQRAYLEATLPLVGQPANNPVSRSTAAGWSMSRNAPPGPGTRGPIRSSGADRCLDGWGRTGGWATG